MTARRRRIAILGAGPVGLEAALYARALGLDVAVCERGRVAENVRRWGFVRLFSPWSLNVSPLGLEALRQAGRPTPTAGAFPTGKEYCDEYLEPIAASLDGALRTRTEVLAVSRCGLLKGDSPGGKRRGGAPFRLLLRGPSGELETTADIVLDSTGVYATPSCLGDGGIPALGEESLQKSSRSAIDYHLPDVLGADRRKFAARTTLIVGAGFSAATTLSSLVRLCAEEPRTSVVWARRRTGPDPFHVVSSDPLPERSRLANEMNGLAAEPPPGVAVISGATVRSIARVGSRLRVEFRPVEGGGTADAVDVDRIIAQVGYRPDTSIFRELQVHQCYASEGPMALAAALLGSGNTDCLAQKSFGHDTLRNPEPGFFVVGHKSYGRRSDFLLRVGREQVRDVFRLIEDDPALDLYGTSEANPPRVRDGKVSSNG